MIMHRLVCMPVRYIVDIMSIDEKMVADMTDKYYKSTYMWIVHELFKNILNMDTTTCNWTKNLIRLSYLDFEGLEYIASEVGISQQKLAYYKAICSTDTLYLKNLFNAIAAATKFPTEIVDNLIDMLDGDVNAFFNILEMKINQEESVFGSALGGLGKGKVNPEEKNKNQKEDLKQFINILSSMINGSNVEEKEYKWFFGKLNFNKSMVNYTKGFNSVLTGNYF